MPLHTRFVVMRGDLGQAAPVQVAEPMQTDNDGHLLNDAAAQVEPDRQDHYGVVRT